MIVLRTIQEEVIVWQLHIRPRILSIGLVVSILKISVNVLINLRNCFNYESSNRKTYRLGLGKESSSPNPESENEKSTH